VKIERMGRDERESESKRERERESKIPIKPISVFAPTR